MAPGRALYGTDLLLVVPIRSGTHPDARRLGQAAARRRIRGAGRSLRRCAARRRPGTRTNLRPGRTADKSLRRQRRVAPEIHAGSRIGCQGLAGRHGRRNIRRGGFRRGQYGFTSATSTSTLTACPMRSTDKTRRALAMSFRIKRPTTPLRGPWTTSTIAPSAIIGHGSY